MRDGWKALRGTLRALWKEDDGQSMVEHALLLGYVTLATVGLMMGPARDVKGVWETANSQLTVANTKAS